MSRTAAIGPASEVADERPAERSWAGWIKVVVAAVFMMATLPGRTQGLGLITEPMLRDLQLDRVAYATINLWATLLGAAICLPIGRVFDRAGLGPTTALLTVLLAGVVWTMSGLAGGVLALFALVLATRALGQSALSISSITAVGKAFDRSVGMAMGVYSVLLTVFFAAAFTGVGTSVRINGWRTAWAQVALGLMLIAPLAFFLRERHRKGSDVQGEATAHDEREATRGDSLTLADALRTPAFWVFAGATSLFGLVSSGLGLFNEAVLAERGFSQQTYVTFLTVTTVIGLAGQFGCGWLSMRVAMPRLLGIAMFFYGVALLILPSVSSAVSLWAFATLLGLSGGMVTVIFFAVWRRGFGPAHLGRIQGAAQMLTVLASAIGPLIFAESAARFGSYFPAIWLLAPSVLAVSMVALRVKLPVLDARSA
jgi:MFS family permease